MTETIAGAGIGAEWYKAWFDSPYYHLLYRHRDDAEARCFIDRLLVWLQPAPEARLLDLACGKGRFAVYLAGKGFDVTGLDLSGESIRSARREEAPNLAFYRHDMRLPFRVNYYDYLFSFFTSFGYFSSERDDLRTLHSVRSGLRKGGTFVLDYFNSTYVKDHLPGEETRTVDGVVFHLHKWEEGDRVRKRIRVEDDGRYFEFEESVRLFSLADFRRLFSKAGLEISAVFGDYHLQIFDPGSSPRLILIAQK
ncbi:MAG: class I SAM-dependent methyltransferase [Saprospiraceae bacterium]